MTTYQNMLKIAHGWKPVKKPAEVTENRLVEAILSGTFPPHSHLPGERELSEILGVTRPTLREALQRLARDGWLEIHQGKPTRVRDFWQEGKLGILNMLSERPEYLPENFIPNLLNARVAMAPMYTELAVSNNPQKIEQTLADRSLLKDTPAEFTQFDWALQHLLTILSENAVFVMILNGFKDMYLNLALFYFSIPEARQHSLDYYEKLADAVSQKDARLAGVLTEDIMRESLVFWQQTKLM